MWQLWLYVRKVSSRTLEGAKLLRWEGTEYVRECVWKKKIVGLYSRSFKK